MNIENYEWTRFMIVAVILLDFMMQIAVLSIALSSQFSLMISNYKLNLAFIILSVLTIVP